VILRLRRDGDDSKKRKRCERRRPLPEPRPRYDAKLGLAEIRHAFEAYAEKYPPVLDVNQAAEISRLAPGTLKRKASEGAFKYSVKRGKPLLFWRDKFVQELMKG
jgi:hypothetical protein